MSGFAWATLLVCKITISRSTDPRIRGSSNECDSRRRRARHVQSDPAAGATRDAAAGESRHVKVAQSCARERAMSRFQSPPTDRQ